MHLQDTRLLAGQNRYVFYILMNCPFKKNLYQVHVFDKNADETISWISEKEAEISTDELGQDLETIQSLLERQQGFQRDLAAIQQQVIFKSSCKISIVTKLPT